jgi:hypothetical protein
MSPGYRMGVPPPGLTYSIDVQDSTIDNAGRGLFIRGKVMPGDIIAFYPGTVYTSQDIEACGGMQGLISKVGISSIDYMKSRAGGILIDALGSCKMIDPDKDPKLHSIIHQRNGLSINGVDSSSSQSSSTGSKERADGWPMPKGQLVAGAKNGWANAHFANHPPRGSTANVIAWPYDFPPQCPPSLFPYLPNTYAMRSTIDDEVTRLSRHTIVLVAACEMNDGDECFLDYAIDKHDDANNNITLPDWYSPPVLRNDKLAEDSSNIEDIKPMTQLDVCKKALQHWKEEFNKVNGRAPNRHDMIKDPVAFALFTEFQRLNTLTWEE